MELEVDEEELAPPVLAGEATCELLAIGICIKVDVEEQEDPLGDAMLRADPRTSTRRCATEPMSTPIS